MSEKSHVSLDTKICPICTKQHEIGILLDRRLKNSMEKNTITGYSICPECKEHLDNGFMGLVEIDVEKSGTDSKNYITFENAWRTGNIMFAKKEMLKHILGDNYVERPFSFVEPEFISILQEMVPKE